MYRVGRRIAFHRIDCQKMSCVVKVASRPARSVDDARARADLFLGIVSRAPLLIATLWLRFDHEKSI